MSRRWVLVPALAACALAVALFLPFLLAEREPVAAVPSPRALFDVTLVDVPAGRPLCLSEVTIPPDAGQVRVQAVTFGRPGPAMTVTLSAPGYRERTTVAAGYADGALLAAPVRPPRTAVLGRVCLERGGSARFALAGTSEARTRSRPEDTVGGRSLDADTYLAFYENGTARAPARLSSILENMSAFRPGVVGPWLLWPLLVLTVLGVPAGVLWAALCGAG